MLPQSAGHLEAYSVGVSEMYNTLYLFIYFNLIIYLCMYASSLLDCLHKCMKNIPYKTALQYGLPDDEHKMFETGRRKEEFN